MVVEYIYSYGEKRYTERYISNKIKALSESSIKQTGECVAFFSERRSRLLERFLYTHERRYVRAHLYIDHKKKPDTYF